MVQIKEEDISFLKWQKGTVNELSSWIGPEMEEYCRKEPSSVFAKRYRELMKHIILNDAIPLAELIKRNAAHLAHWTTAEHFKKRFPISAKNGWGRNLYFLQFVCWTEEFKGIIEDKWSNENYELMYPFGSLFHCKFVCIALRCLRT